MKEPRLLGAVCACLFTLFSMSSEAVMIDFDLLEEPSNSDFNYISSGNYSEDGFTITGAPMYYNGQDYVDFYAGSAGLNLQAPGALTTLERLDGNPFSIESIGLSKFINDGGSSAPVMFTGYISGGGTVTQSFQPMFPDPLDPSSFIFIFSDFYFNPSFTNLTSVSWNQSSIPAQGHQFDNIVVTASAVPIPAAVWLFGSGLLGLTGLARRKKA